MSTNGTTFTNVTNSGTISGATTTTLSLISNITEAGEQFRAVFTNALGSVTSNAVTLNVLAAETSITDWNFNDYSSSNDFNNSPAPTGGVLDAGTATTLGMTLPYNPLDPATGTDGNGSVAADDITNSPGSLNPNFNENTWRIRGGPTATTGGTPANGWSNFVPEYTQGAQWSVPTTGYGSIYVTLDWYATTSGELDAQEQYTTNGTTWININNPVQAVSNDFYGATAVSDSRTITSASLTSNVATLQAANDYSVGQTVNVTGVTPSQFNGSFTITAATSTSFSYALTGANVAATAQSAATSTIGGQPVPLVIDVSNIPGVANNPNFGVRLVNAYDPTLSNTQTLTINDSNNFTLTFNDQTAPVTYSSTPATLAANIQSALAALSNVGTGNVSVTATNGAIYSVTFGGLLNTVAQPAMTVSDPVDTIGYNPQYANAALVGTPPAPAPYNGSKGNWRFDNIEVHGIASLPAWLAPGSVATFNSTTNTLTVTGAATIIADPGVSVDPVITANGPLAQLTIAPTAGDVDIHVGGITLTGGAGLTMASVGTGRSHGNHNVLVLGTLGATTDPTFVVDSASKLNLEDNDLIIHTGSSDAHGYTELANVQAMAAVGRASVSGSGTWKGNELTSSVAASQDTASGFETNILAVVDNTDLPLGSYSKWVVGSASETLANHDILVKYTYNGDFGLEGLVSTDAASILGAFYQSGVKQNDSFAFGDTNDDGFVDGNDAALFGGVLYGLGTSSNVFGSPALSVPL